MYILYFYFMLLNLTTAESTTPIYFNITNILFTYINVYYMVNLLLLSDACTAH